MELYGEISVEDEGLGRVRVSASSVAASATPSSRNAIGTIRLQGPGIRRRRRSRPSRVPVLRRETPIRHDNGEQLSAKTDSEYRHVIKVGVTQHGQLWQHPGPNCFMIIYRPRGAHGDDHVEVRRFWEVGIDTGDRNLASDTTWCRTKS